MLLIVALYTGWSRSEGWEQGRYGCRDVAMSHISQNDAMAHGVDVAYMGHRGLDRSEEKQYRYTSENGRVYGTKDVSDT